MTELGYYTKLDQAQRAIDARAQEWQARLKWSADIQIALSNRSDMAPTGHIPAALRERISCRRESGNPHDTSDVHNNNHHP